MSYVVIIKLETHWWAMNMWKMHALWCHLLCFLHLIATYRCSFAEKRQRVTEKSLKIGKTQYFTSLRESIFLPADHSIASANRLRHSLSLFLSLSLSTLFLSVILAAFPYLRPWVAPYFKRHISRDHASSASKMSMPPAGFATATSHGAGPPWRRGIVSLCRLAANYTLMRRRVIRRRCTKWKWWGTRGWSEKPVEVSFGNIPAFRYSQLT